MGVKFDLSPDEEAKIRGLDRREAFDLIRAIGSENWRIQFIFDDPEMSLGSEDVGYNALAGLIQAANQINSSVGEAFQVTILLKTHLKPIFSKYEEVANIHPNRVSYLSWTKDDLKSALLERINSSGLGKEKLLPNFDADFDHYVYPLLRNGPRDMFALTSLAYGKNGCKPLSGDDLNGVVGDVASYSLAQISTGYQGVLPDIGALVSEIFSDRDWKSYSELREHISTKRANSSDMQAIDASNKLDTSSKYIEFLAQSGCVQMREGGDPLSPFEARYSQGLGSLQRMSFRLHPLLVQHPSVSLT